MISISTTWNYFEDCDLKAMLSDIRQAGIRSIELGYNFTASRLQEITPLLYDFGIEVVSVHNFCPLPPQGALRRFFTNYYLLSSLAEKEREDAVKYTKQTIDTAAGLKAKVVVIHAGVIEFDAKYIKTLINLYKLGKIDSEEADNLRKEIIRIRDSKKQAYLDAVTKSLDEITDYATKADIKIGLENRYYPDEIPSNGEIALFLEKFNTRGLVYWHDVGHSLAQERLGMIKKNSLLESFGGYLFGLHLHGIKGLNDHRAPLSGDFDFSQISQYLARADLLKVIEAHQPVSSNDIKEAIRYFAAKGWF
ncbi:MAG: TIM barrel protein [Candidatus Omnitrophota bacterium]